MVKSSKQQSLHQNNKTKTEHDCVSQADYDIPRFGYRSSFFILVSTLFTLFIVPLFCDFLDVDYRMPTTIFGGFTAGFASVYAQFFIEQKIGFTKHFWIVGGLLSVFCAMLIFIAVYIGIII